MRDSVDATTGEPTQVKAPYVWDEGADRAVPFDTEGVHAALEGSFEVDGRACVTEFTRLKDDLAECTLDWAEGITGVAADTIARIAEEYAEGPSVICNGVGGVDKIGNNDVAGHAYTMWPVTRTLCAHLSPTTTASAVRDAASTLTTLRPTMP